MRWMWALLAVVAVSLAGCGDDKPPEEQTYETEGDVQPAYAAAADGPEASRPGDASAAPPDEPATTGTGSSGQSAPAGSSEPTAGPDAGGTSSADDSEAEESPAPEPATLPALPPVPPLPAAELPTL